MRVMLVHCRYLQRGGEDTVFEAETALLAERGVETLPYTVSNEELLHVSPLTQAFYTIWNRHQASRLASVARSFRPDVVHFHNTFPFMSPAVLLAAKEARAATVQTLHNYRLLCPAATFYRDGHVCEDCLPHSVPWPSVRFGCYRDSRAASAGVAAMLATHRLFGTYRRFVDRFIAPTAFVRGKFVSAGFAPEKVSIKPHFLSTDPALGEGEGGYVLFVGRLSREKGIGALLEAWKSGISAPLRIVGDGPLREAVASAVAESHNMTWLGPLGRTEVIEQMRGAALLVFPTELYETFGMVAIEAFATGLPVVAPDHGAVAEVVRDGVTGALFRPGDPGDLRAKVEGLLADPERILRMRVSARREYSEKYTADRNFQALMGIYEAAVRDYQRSRRARGDSYA